MTNNRPHSRPTGSSTSSSGVHKRGGGLGTGPVGNSSRPSSSSSSSSSSSRPTFTTGGGGGYNSQGPRRSSGGGIGIIGIIVVAALVLFGGGNLGDLFSMGGTSSGSSYTSTSSGNSGTSTTASSYNPLSTFNQSYVNTSDSAVDTSVASNTRNKFTTLVGNGKDTVTVLVYMCGADLESSYGMATADINEMAYATQSDQVNVIINTGGAKKWQNNVVSNTTNQYWKVTTKGLISLENNLGAKSMTDPSTLVSFLKYGKANFPADRYILIFWDHGGGSLTGYGYDEKFPNGSMTIDEISDALKQGGMKYDIIGFDACLMATAETAFAVSPYADYLIASEEVEPGTGWYYTNWLSTLAKNPSTDSLSLGKEIVDDYISESRKSSSRSSLSLSLTDLGEFVANVPDDLTAFAKQVKTDVESDAYQTVADARSNAKEFAQSNKLDQVDLVNFCTNMNTAEGKALAESIQSAVKYNQVYNMNNAYGISIYFPYSSISKVNSAANLYSQIGMDSSYSDCMRSFATLESSGQITASGSSNSLFDILSGGSTSNGFNVDPSSILSLLQGGSSSSDPISALLGGGSSSGFDLGSIASFLGRNHVDTTQFTLTEKNGTNVLQLDESQWKLIHDVLLNVWVDDGEGYIDLGYDNVFDFDADGDLLCVYDGTWLALNDQVVSYYMTNDIYDGDTFQIDGYIPAMLNGQRVNILVQFTNENPNGTVLGAQVIYDTETEAKGLIEIQEGDTIDFLCDYYDYQGNYSDSYYLGEQYTVDAPLTISQVNLEGVNVSFTYKLVDCYNAEYWTPAQTYQN